MNPKPVKKSPLRADHPELPLSLRLVVAVFLLLGLIGVVLTAYYATRGQITLDPLVVGLPIGVGLWRRKAGWRTCALTTAVLAIIAALLLVVMCVSGLGSFVLSFLPEDLRLYFFALVFLLLLVTFSMVWSFQILTRPRIRQLFDGSATDSVAGTLSSLSIVLLLLCVSRFTGGIGGSLSFKNASFQSSAYGGGMTLGELGAVQPLIIEVRAEGDVSYYVFAWTQTRQRDRSGTRTNTRTYWKRYSGLLVPKGLADSRNRIVVDVSKPELSGLYWVPLIKLGKGSIKAKLAGTGRYQSYSHNLGQDVEFQVVGPFTTANLRSYLRHRVEQQAISFVVKSASNKRGLTALEKACRELPLDGLETANLAAAYRRLGDRYQQAEKYADASAVYRRSVLALESQLFTDSSPREPINEHSRMRDLAQSYSGIAWQLSTNPQPEDRNGFEALTCAERACKISNWEDEKHLEALAAAYAETGDFEHAVEWQERALLLPTQGEAEEAQRRLALYRSGKAYRAPRVQTTEIDSDLGNDEIGQ